MALHTAKYNPSAAHGEFSRRGPLENLRIVRVVFMVLGPCAVSGIAVGATAVILTQADPALHRSLLTLIWGATVVTSGIIVTGIALLGRHETLDEH